MKPFEATLPLAPSDLSQRIYSGFGCRGKGEEAQEKTLIQLGRTYKKPSKTSKTPLIFINFFFHYK